MMYAATGKSVERRMQRLARPAPQPFERAALERQRRANRELPHRAPSFLDLPRVPLARADRGEEPDGFNWAKRLRPLVGFVRLCLDARAIPVRGADAGREYLWKPRDRVLDREARRRCLKRSAFGLGQGPRPAPVTTIALAALAHHVRTRLATYPRGLTVWPLRVEDTEWYGDVDEALAATNARGARSARLHRRTGRRRDADALGEGQGALCPDPLGRARGARPRRDRSPRRREVALVRYLTKPVRSRGHLR